MKTKALPATRPIALPALVALLLFPFALAPLHASAPAPGLGDVQAEIAALLAEQAAAWSRGDLEAFCSVYADDTTFLTTSGLTRGRQAVYERYRQRYPDRAALGTLTLEILEVRLAGCPGEAADATAAPADLCGPDSAEPCGGGLLTAGMRASASAESTAGGTVAATPGTPSAPEAPGVAAASVAARWKLSYPDKPAAEGLTLVVLHRRDGRWWIVEDASM